jgi:hypothetical protein
MKRSQGVHSRWMWVVAMMGLLNASCAMQQSSLLTGDGRWPHILQTKPPMVRAPDAATKIAMQVAYSSLPLHFEPNQGQADERVNFLACSSGYTLFLTTTEAVLALWQKSESQSQKREFDTPDSGLILRMQLVGANSNPQVAGREGLPGKAN